MRDILRQMVLEDVGFEDITTNALIPENMESQARIVSKEKGIISGIHTVSELFNEFNLEINTIKKEGEEVKPNDVIMEIVGNTRLILTLERTVLNLLMRMSGIATLTFSTLKEIRKVNNNVILACTRKTTPGLQFLEKSAVKTGGGDTHRFRLDDSVLIKDNHIEIVGSIEESIIKARKDVSFTKKIEIEVENLDDAVIALKTGADVVMLDNRSPEEIIDILSSLESLGLRNNALIEVSGGIKPENIAEYAKTGADIISVGYLIHSAPALDLSLEVFN